MAAADFLKKVRDSDYSEPEKGDSHDPDQPNETSRIIKLSDDEQKAFQGSQPGEELSCEVRGNLEKDGHFHVMSVAPLGGGSSYGSPDEGQMAQQVAQRVSPTLQPSPS